MVEKVKKEAENAQKTIIIDNGQPFVVPIVSERKKLVYCDVCGHANPEEVALCEMCSNYLNR